MRRAYFFSGLLVDSDLLNYDAAARSDSVKLRIKALLNSDAIPAGSGSIVGKPGDTALQVANSGAGTITVTEGMAIDKNGDWIYVPNDPTILDDMFEPEKPARVINLLDDLGIALADTNTYHFGIAYQEASGCVKSNRDGELFATRYYDSYQWVASGSALPSPMITLAKITRLNPTTFTLEDCRTEQWLGCQTNAKNVLLTNTPLSTMQTVEDHINMVGDATLVSATNPHGVIIYQDFSGIINPPTGLTQNAKHGQDAHDDSVPISRTASNILASPLVPQQDGGGVVWCDGYFDYGVDATEVKVLDDNIDWRHRWLSLTAYLNYSDTANTYIPGAANAGSMVGMLDPVLVTPTNMGCGYGYTNAGSDGTAAPYIDLSVTNATIRIWVDSTDGSLKAKVQTWSSPATNKKFSFGVGIEYGPRRNTTV